MAPFISLVQNFFCYKFQFQRILSTFVFSSPLFMLALLFGIRFRNSHCNRPSRSRLNRSRLNLNRPNQNRHRHYRLVFRRCHWLSELVLCPCFRLPRPVFRRYLWLFRRVFRRCLHSRCGSVICTNLLAYRSFFLKKPQGLLAYWARTVLSLPVPTDEVTR